MDEIDLFRRAIRPGRVEVSDHATDAISNFKSQS